MKIIEQLVDLEKIIVGGVNVNNIGYSDYAELFEDNIEKLQKLFMALNRTCVEVRKDVNVRPEKTHVMEPTERSKNLSVNNTLHGKPVSQVDK